MMISCWSADAISIVEDGQSCGCAVGSRGSESLSIFDKPDRYFFTAGG